MKIMSSGLPLIEIFAKNFIETNAILAELTNKQVATSWGIAGWKKKYGDRDIRSTQIIAFGYL